MSNLINPGDDAKNTPSSPDLTGTFAQYGFCTASALQRMDLPEPSWVVPGVLPEGLSLLVAKPKVGKSLAGLDIGLGLSTGTEALGVPVEQMDVLLLMLEGGLSSLKSRIASQLDGRPWPDTFRVLTQCPVVGDPTTEGFRLLEAILTEYPSTGLVIVDTLAHVRPPARGGQSLYAADYAAIAPYKRLREQFGVNVMIVHHTRKDQEGDSTDRVSGTTGLSGAVDNLLDMRKTSDTVTTLTVTARDKGDHEHRLVFDSDRTRWTLEAGPTKRAGTPEQQKVLDVLLACDVPLSPAEIAGRIGHPATANNVSQLLKKLVRDGSAVTPHYGKYVATANVTPADPSPTAPPPERDEDGSVTAPSEDPVRPPVLSGDGVPLLPGSSYEVTVTPAHTAQVAQTEDVLQPSAALTGQADGPEPSTDQKENPPRLMHYYEFEELREQMECRRHWGRSSLSGMSAAFRERSTGVKDIGDFIPDFDRDFRLAGRKHGGEFHGPHCPFCGSGNDRFVVWPGEREHGAFWCRSCRKAGDAIDLLRERDGMTYDEARRALGSPVDARSDTSPGVLANGPKFPSWSASRTDTGPGPEWNRKAKDLYRAAREWLWSEDGAEGLRYLRERGFTDDTIRDAGLGFNPSTRYESCTDWGVDASVPGQKLVVPQGVVIPAADGTDIARIKVRRTAPQPHERKYHVVRGSRTPLYGANTLKEPDRPVVVTEGELDALTVRQVAGDLVYAVATGSAQGGRDAVDTLTKYPAVLLAFDADRAGHEAAEWWASRLPNARLLTPLAHDVNEMLTSGLDVREWIAEAVSDGA